MGDSTYRKLVGITAIEDLNKISKELYNLEYEVKTLKFKLKLVHRIDRKSILIKEIPFKDPITGQYLLKAGIKNFKEFHKLNKESLEKLSFSSTIYSDDELRKRILEEKEYLKSIVNVDIL